MWKSSTSTRPALNLLIFATAFQFVQPAVAVAASTHSIFALDADNPSFEAGLHEPGHTVRRDHTGAWDGPPNGRPGLQFADEHGRDTLRSHFGSHDDHRRVKDDDHDRDGIIFSAVPEPTTYLMLLAGLGSIGVIARNRRRRRV
jgi:hypothetical protein